MSTRGAYGYRIDGQDKITYCHFDAYPGGLGMDILKYARDFTPIQMSEVARRIILVDQNDKAPPEMIDRYSKYANRQVSKGEMTEWYVLLRETQGDLRPYHDGLDHLIDMHSFLGDSVFCEWAYIVNLDAACLEAYKGFNYNPKAPGRYANMGGARGNYGVALIDTVPFIELIGLTDKELVKYIERWNAKGEE